MLVRGWWLTLVLVLVISLAAGCSGARETINQEDQSAHQIETGPAYGAQQLYLSTRNRGS